MLSAILDAYFTYSQSVGLLGLSFPRRRESRQVLDYTEVVWIPAYAGMTFFLHFSHYQTDSCAGMTTRKRH